MHKSKPTVWSYFEGKVLEDFGVEILMEEDTQAGDSVVLLTVK